MPPASRCWPSCRSSSPSSTLLQNELPDDIGLQGAASCGDAEASFLFIPDLTAKAAGGELIALLVLYVGTQLISGLVMAVTADKSQRMMMFVLPFIFVPFMISFPAGLVLYWITTNVWTIGQQYVIQKLIPAPEVRDAGGGRAAAKPPPPPPRKKKRSGARARAAEARSWPAAGPA